MTGTRMCRSLEAQKKGPPGLLRSGPREKLRAVRLLHGFCLDVLVQRLAADP